MTILPKKLPQHPPHTHTKTPRTTEIRHKKTKKKRSRRAGPKTSRQSLGWNQKMVIDFYSIFPHFLCVHRDFIESFYRLPLSLRSSQSLAWGLWPLKEVVKTMFLSTLRAVPTHISWYGVPHLPRLGVLAVYKS